MCWVVCARVLGCVCCVTMCDVMCVWMAAYVCRRACAGCMVVVVVVWLCVQCVDCVVWWFVCDCVSEYVLLSVSCGWMCACRLVLVCDFRVCGVCVACLCVRV